MGVPPVIVYGSRAGRPCHVNMNDIPNYLTPYHDAVRRHAGGFGSLLWASTLTQAARFETICRLVNLTGRSILDIGCGRADLLNYLQTRNIAPADYIGIEAVPPLLAAASDTIKNHRNARIIDADFLAKPASMFVGGGGCHHQRGAQHA